MLRQLAAGFAVTLVMAAQCCAADLRGDWIFTPSAEFPEFTTLSIEGPSGSIRSLWYGDLPLLNLHQDGERILKPLALSESEVADLVAFLESLSQQARARHER
jgi:hypothetical protein